MISLLNYKYDLGSGELKAPSSFGVSLSVSDQRLTDVNG